MQIKKDEVKLAILKEAEKEFLTKGFRNSSIRRIVKSAGTTIGNFYNYFKNKETLFAELVSEEYRNFRFLIENHDKLEQPDYLEYGNSPAQWRKVLADIIENIIPVFSDRFILLVECSEGTKYEGVRKMIVDLMKEHFIQHMQQSGSDCDDCAISEVIAEQMLHGVIFILKKYRDGKVRRALLAEHMLFHFMGTMGIMDNKA